MAGTGIRNWPSDSKAHCLVWFCYLLYTDSLGKATGRKNYKRTMDMTVQVFTKHLLRAQHRSLPRRHGPWGGTRAGEKIDRGGERTVSLQAV